MKLIHNGGDSELPSCFLIYVVSSLIERYMYDALPVCLETLWLVYFEPEKSANIDEDSWIMANRRHEMGGVWTYPSSLHIHRVGKADILQEEQKRLQSVVLLLCPTLTTPGDKKKTRGENTF